MKNTHLEHLEDDILNSGSAGGKDVISFLRQFGHMLTGIPSELSVTTKWDGAPAIVCGTEPITRRFFVGTKSGFNKVNPKICFDGTDVDRFYKGQLADKLKDCLEYLPQLNISGIVQGDLLEYSSHTSRGVIFFVHIAKDISNFCFCLMTPTIQTGVVWVTSARTLF